MSEEKPVDTSACCASCGVAEIDDIKLVPCDGCDLVKYCSDDCKENHKSEHDNACKKRAAELRDELLFKQPESTHRGDCPICCVPLPLDPRRSFTYDCCSKVICKGCLCANAKRETERRLQYTCPFCREPVPTRGKEIAKLRMKRVKANDPVAIFEEGIQQYKKGDYRSAFYYYSKAADLGDVEAHWRMANMYAEGHGVEEDWEKEIYHYEQAAVGGHPEARVLLGMYEYSKNNLDRAVKHYIIAASQGDDYAIKMLMDGFKEGYVEKEVLAAALRAQKAAVDETKSPERQAEEKLMSEYRNRWEDR